jgi:hypothetical protein
MPVEKLKKCPHPGCTTRIAKEFRLCALHTSEYVAGLQERRGTCNQRYSQRREKTNGES